MTKQKNGTRKVASLDGKQTNKTNGKSREVLQTTKTNGAEPFIMDRTGSCDGEHWHVRWEIPAKDVPKVLRYARLFGFGKIKPLIQSIETGTLRGQVIDWDKSELIPKGAKIAITGLPPRETKVLAGVAREWSQTVNELLRESINNQLRTMLGECLLHPKTGEILHAGFSEEYRTRRDVKPGGYEPARTITMRG